jgi:SAM-dependent methyltransferase
MTSDKPTYLRLLEEIRDVEIRQLAQLLPSGGRLLEIGAGSGWQARFLAARGFDVEAIDVEASEYRDTQVWPVLIYDGQRLPFPDASFDVVFSSNVLEHIAALDSVQREIARVLRPGGVALHTMPSSSWRLWTILAHYPWLGRQVVARLMGDGHALQNGPTAMSGQQSAAVSPDAQLKRVKRWRRWLTAGRHGEHGGMLHELWLFSRLRWRRVFERSGFGSVVVVPLGITYSGYLLFGASIGLPGRKRLARFFGSSCLAYRMRLPDKEASI